MSEIPDMNLPDSSVRTYPRAEPIAVDRSSMRNPSDRAPPSPSPMISPITIAVPERPLPDTDRVTSDRTDVTVPMEATVEMNLSGLSSPMKHAATDAPTVAVIPGNHPAIHPVTTPLSPGPGPTGSAPSSL